MREVTISSCNNADQNKKRCLLQASDIKPVSGIHYRKNNKFKSSLLTGLLLSVVFFTANALASIVDPYISFKGQVLKAGAQYLSNGSQYLIEQVIPPRYLVYIEDAILAGEAIASSEVIIPVVAGAALAYEARKIWDQKHAPQSLAKGEQLLQEYGGTCGDLGNVGCQLALGHKIVKESDSSTVKNSHSEEGLWNKSGGRDPAALGNRVFKLDIVQSGSVTIDLSSLGLGEERVDTYLYLLDSHRTKIAYNDDHPHHTTLNSHLTKYLHKGTYYVVAATFQKGEKGDFKVTVAGAESKFGFIGDQVEGKWIDSGGKNFQSPGNVVHQIRVRKSGEVQIDLSSNVDTYLYVLNSRKERIYFNDDIDYPAGNLNSRVTKHLEEGTYYLVAATYSKHQKGDYKLAVAGNAQFTHLHGPLSIGLFRMTNLGIKPAPIKTDEVTKNSQIKPCSSVQKHALHPNDLCLDNKYIIQGTYLREVETNTDAPFRVEQKTNPQTGFPKYILKNSHRPTEQQETLIYEVTHYDISGDLIWGLSERISQQSNAEEGYYRWRYNIQGYPTLYEYGKNRQSNNKSEPLVSLAYNYQQIRINNVDKTFLDYIVEYTSSKAADLEKGSIYQLQYEPSKLDISAIIQTLKNGEKMPWAIGEIAYSIKIADTEENYNLCLEFDRFDKQIVPSACYPDVNSQKFHLVSENNSRVFSLQNKGNQGCWGVESGTLKNRSCSGKDNQQFNLIHQDQRGIQLQVKSSGLCLRFVNELEMVQCDKGDTRQRFKFEYQFGTLSDSLGHCSDKNCYYLPHPPSDKYQPYYVVPEKVYDPKSGLLMPVLGFQYSFDGKIMLKTLSPSASSICPEEFNDIQAPGTDGITFQKIKVSQPLENAAGIVNGVIGQGKNYYFKKTQMILWSLAQGALNQDKLHKGLSSEFKEEFKPTINKALGKLPDLKNLFGLKPMSSVGDGSAIDANTSVKDLANLICPTPGHSVSPIVSPKENIDSSCEQEDSTTDSEDKGNSDAQMLAFIKYMQKYPDQLGKTLAGVMKNDPIPLCKGFNPTQGSICKEATPAEHPDPEEVEVGNDRGQSNKTEEAASMASGNKTEKPTISPTTAFDVRWLSFRVYFGNNKEDFVRGFVQLRWTWQHTRKNPHAPIPKYYTMTFENKTIPGWKPANGARREAENCNNVVDLQLANGLSIRLDDKWKLKDIYWYNRLTLSFISSFREVRHSNGFKRHQKFRFNLTPVGVAYAIMKDGHLISEDPWLIPELGLTARNGLTHAIYIAIEDDHWLNAVMTAYNFLWVYYETKGSKKDTQTLFHVADMRWTPVEWTHTREFFQKELTTQLEPFAIIFPKIIYKSKGMLDQESLSNN